MATQEADQQTAAPADEKVTKKVTSKKSARKKAEIRRRRNRARRLALMVLLTLAAVAFGLYAVTQVWYTVSIPASTVVDRNMQTVESVSAVGSITGWGLTHQEVSAPIETMGSPMIQAATPSAAMGLPLPAFFLLLLGLFALVGGVMRQGFVTGIGVVCGFFAWKQLATLRGIMEDPNFGGDYNTAGPGIASFQLGLACAVTMLMLVTVQVVLVNAERRRKERERAKKAGEQVLPTFMEVVHAMALSQLTKHTSVPDTVKAAQEGSGDKDGTKAKAGTRS